MSQADINSGVHQLPSDCYPPTDSDDESFVVLDHSPGCSRESVHMDLLVADVIDQSLETATDVINEMTKSSSLANVPAMPKVDVGNEFLTSMASVSTYLTNDEVQQKVYLLVEENTKLKDTLNQNNLVMKNQYETLVKWQEDVEKVHQSHKMKFSEMKTYIKDLQKENLRLNTLLKKEEIPAMVVSTKTEELESAFNSLKLTSESEIGRISLKNAQIEEENVRIKEELNKLKEINDNLKKNNEKWDESKLKYLEQITGLKKSEEKWDESEQKYLEQITSLKLMNEKLKNSQVNVEEMSILRKQLMSAQVCVMDLKQEKKAIEAESETLRNQISTLKESLRTLEADRDRTIAVEQQLLLYKADFETERNCKQTTMDEKNKLVEDLHNMQRRNNEMLEELETLRTKCSFVEVTSGNVASAPPPIRTVAPPSPPLTSYSCPLCMKTFRSYTAVQNHVESCMSN